MIHRTLFVAALLLPFAFGTAVAHDCPVVEESVYLEAVAMHVTMAPGLWHETNGVAGLQTSDGACFDDNGREFSWVADTRLV